MKKVLLPGIAGAVVYFLLGYLFYGVLFKDAMSSHIPGVDRPMEEMVWWSMILGNLSFGLLLAYVIAKPGSASAMSGAMTGAVVGLLMSASYDLMMFATTHLLSEKMIVQDIAISVVMSIITGAVVGGVNAMGAKKAA